jgi:hypothetical protein
MLNPDGVFLGNYRTAFCGLDLNRQYADPTEWCTPENYHLKKMLRGLANDSNVALDFVIDLHSHSTAMNGFSAPRITCPTPSPSPLTIPPPCADLGSP